MKWTPEKEATLRRMWDDGKTAAEIAVAVGEPCSDTSVIRKRHSLGLKKRTSFPKRKYDSPIEDWNDLP